MKNDILSAAHTTYDLDGIRRIAKRKLLISVLVLALCLAVLILSVLAIVFYGSYLAVFIVAVVLICISALLFAARARKIKLSDYRATQGEIVEFIKDVKNVSTTAVGGINPFGARKYDTYRRNEIRCDIFIKSEDGIRSHHLKGITEKQASYYEERGAAIHMWGTRFPVKVDTRDGEWLCPFCGSLNPNEEKNCSCCKNRVMR